MKNYILFFLIFGLTKIGYGQSVQRTSLNSGGNTTTNSGVSMSSSFGQPFSSYLESSTVKIYSGFQQKLNNVSASINSKNNLNSIEIYPNPFIREIIINVSNPIISESIRLYQMTGQRIYPTTILKNGDQYTLYLEELSSGIYTLQFEDKNHSIINYKLIK